MERSTPARSYQRPSADIVAKRLAVVGVALLYFGAIAGHVPSSFPVDLARTLHVLGQYALLIGASIVVASLAGWLMLRE